MMDSSAPGKTENTRNPFNGKFVTPLFMGSTLNPINSSLIATALVPIALEMHVSVGTTAILVSVLYMASAIAQPTSGKLSNHFGPRRIFLSGIATIFVGGAIGGFGRAFDDLVLARILIGVGTSSAYPSAMLIIRRRAKKAGMSEPPGSVLGGLVIAAMVTIAVGLPIGGILVGTLGWRTTFLINIPLALVALPMTFYWIPRDDPVDRTVSVRELASRIDVGGTVGFGISMIAFMVFLFSLPRLDWTALAAGIISSAGLVAWELRAAQPFLDVRLMARNPGLTRSYLRYSLATLCIYTILYGLTQWLEAGRGVTAEEAGFLILPMSALSAVIARWVSRRNMVRLPLVAAAFACLVGSIGIMELTASTSAFWIVVITLLFGITLGASSTGNQTTLYSEVTSSQIATASGLLRTFGYLGSIISSAIIAIAFQSSVTDSGLHFVGEIMVAVSLASIAVVLADRKVMRTSRVTETA